MRRVFLSVLFASGLAACRSTHIDSPVAFDASEAAFIQKDGKATIEGHAFVTNRSGGVVNAAGQTVWLIPSTAYARQRFAAIYGGAKSIPARAIPKADSDPAYSQYTRQTKTTSGGKFTFEKVAPGDYFVVSQMTWKKEDAMFPDGAAMFETVKITGAETDSVDVVVSGNASGT